MSRYHELPNDVPLSKIHYSQLNEPTMDKKILTHYLKNLCRVRGKFQALKVMTAELTMDYDSLLSEGKEEQLLEQLDLRLERLMLNN